ncbi:MAG: diguanylate cyclase [Patulibacter minatonensis]
MPDRPTPRIDESGRELLGRLRALEQTHHLGADGVFDRLAHRAVEVVDAAGGLASLIDGGQQVFISQIGLDEPWASLGEAPADRSFCSLVVDMAAPLIVGDARLDDRLVACPAVRDHGVVAYAGFPLRAGGRCIGALCVFDRVPREWSERELVILAALAESASAELDLHLALADRDAADEASQGEVRYRSLASAMAAGVVLQDRFGVIRDCNRAAQQLLGLEAAHVLGRSSLDRRWRSVYPDGRDMPGTEHPAMRTLETGEPLRDQVLGIHRPDGALVWLSVSTEPLFDEFGEPESVVVTFADITELRLSAVHRDEQLAEQRALRDLATLVASQATPSTVFAAAAKAAAGVLDANAGGVARLNARRGATLVGAWVPSGSTPPVIGEVVDLEAGTATGSVLKTGAPAYRPRPCAYLRHCTEGFSIASPITVDGELWGALSVAYDTLIGPAEAAARAERLGRFAELVGLGISSSEAREQLARQATIDHLTGLDNQRAFSDRLDQEVSRALRHGRALSLVVFDIDHFKLVNDTHGHATGNDVLVEFAERLRDARRGAEVIARVGGEEFAWILPETTRAEALEAAERVRQSIGAAPFAAAGRLTTSAGVCELGDANDTRQLFRYADMALYWAKAEGRNRTFAYEPGTLELLTGDEQARRLKDATTLAAIRALATAVDAKDPSTQRHSERVADLTAELAVASGWAASDVAELRDAALVHDIGKIGVPDHVLLKPGKLTDAEYDQIKQHSALGAAMVEGVLTALQVSWIRHHHERFDGRGYPDGIAGDAISEGARMMAIADSWDAMTVARPYGTPKSVVEARAEIERGMGHQFCPRAAERFLRLPATQPPAQAPDVVVLERRERR